MKRFGRTLVTFLLAGILLVAAAAPALAAPSKEDAAKFFGSMSIKLNEKKSTTAVKMLTSSAGTYFYDKDGGALGKVTTGKTYENGTVEGAKAALVDFWKGVSYTGVYNPENNKRYTGPRDDQIALDAFNDYRGVQRGLKQTGSATPSSSAASGSSGAASGSGSSGGSGTSSARASNGSSGSGSSKSSGSGGGSGSSGSNTSSVNTEKYAKEVFRLVNKERTKAGLDTVEWDDEFYYCAEIRAEEMSRKFGHTRPEPPEDTSKSWPMNVNGKGEYNAPSVADEQGVAYSWIMENAGMGYASPEAVMKGWMNSSGHKANILRESHGRCGVGVYQSSSGTLYWALWLDE